MIRLLIVEDSALMRKLLTRIFTDEGDFDVAVARDGLEALQTIASFRPDVVTLDVHMPAMDGLACLDRIMIEHPCPVVMVSSLTEEGAEETLTALELGAVDFVAKPGGAISLSIDEIAPRLVQKVRVAAKVHVRTSLRLRERVRLKQEPKRPDGRVKDAKALRVAPSLPSARGAHGEGLVLIGTSTGGPPALDAVLSQLPANLPWPVVVAQHMPSSFTGALARRLDRLCALTVTEVRSTMPLEAGNIYIAHGDADIVISTRAGRTIALSAPVDPKFIWHPSVERLVRSAMRIVPARSLIGVLMTGMGDDGAPAMAELKAAGGRTIAEAEDTAVVWGMPGELVRLGGASEVLPVDAIGGRLAELLA